MADQKNRGDNQQNRGDNKPAQADQERQRAGQARPDQQVQQRNKDKMGQPDKNRMAQPGGQDRKQDRSVEQPDAQGRRPQAAPGDDADDLADLSKGIARDVEDEDADADGDRITQRNPAQDVEPSKK